MARRTAAIIVGLLLVSATLPTVMGRHFSVGTRDSIGTEPVETPNNPTVTDQNHAVGTSLDCFEPDGSLSEEQATRATETDPFCGEIVYHEDNEALRHPSPPDQDLRSTSEVTIDTFDVIETNIFDEDEEPCEPWCAPVVGDPAWETVHTIGEEQGLTEGPDEADEENNGPREQFYGFSLHTPKAAYVLQENTDAWRMNGWWSPEGFHNFVAYVFDDDGNPVSDDDLERMVGEDTPGPLVQSGELHGDSKPIVCGASPDFEFTSLNFEGPACDIFFEYREPGKRAEADFTEGYNDECQSPAWICGGFSGPTWYAQAFCINCQAAQVTTSPNEGTLEYIRYHWFVAPHPSECSGTVEPGFSFDGDGADHPYLAHETDVWTQPYDLKDNQETTSVANVEDFAFEVADQRIDELTDELPGVPDNPVDEPTALYPTQIHKDERTEPNADPVGSLADTSQSLPEDGGLLDRTLESACQEFNSDESSETVDPWVDLVDGGVDTETQRQPSQSAGVGTQGVHTDGVAAYGTSDEGQDQENQPGPELFRTDGNVGMFTDKNDDGDYETLSGNPTVLSTRSVAGQQISLTADKYNPNNIQSTGAYPMLWDIRVDSNEEITSGGCQISDTNTISDEAQAAGYGPNTGLFQTVYLSEPTTFVYSDTGEVLPFAGGENIYLFLSQSAREFYTPGESDANEIDSQIEDAISELRGNVAPSDAEVVVPGDEFGLESDYMGQCGEDTGGFTLEFSFTHECATGCAGDTIVTGYTFEVARADGSLGGGDSVPLFEVDNTAYDFTEGIHTWIDVDPFDNDPSRQDGVDNSPPAEE